METQNIKGNGRIRMALCVFVLFLIYLYFAIQHWESMIPV